MQTEPNAKQQITQAIKKSTNILVTVGKDPSVDALSAALSLTLMLNRLDKHATAVFSGQTPPAITFLKPEKILENTVDSLRDFIIALDKQKADRLRYKVEDDVVRIFITPYKTVISEKDLKFSQGDFNVELIIALGVERKEDLDTAVTAHGRILHDATVVTINSDGGKPTLGSVDWTDTSASSLCEMLMSLSESLQSGLLDEQTATAILTGIVSATDRFRNEHTSPRVMTMAAQLMAAGANQQLIAAKLEEGHELPAEVALDGSKNLKEGQSQKLDEVEPETVAPDNNDGALEIEHESTSEPVAFQSEPVVEAVEPAEEELAQSLSKSAPVAPTISLNDLQEDLAAAAREANEVSETPSTVSPTTFTPTIATPFVPEELSLTLPPQTPHEPPKIIKQKSRNWKTDEMDKPAFGGTLNATTSDAEEASREEEMAKRNQQVLSHGDPSDEEKPEELSQVENTASQTMTPPPPLPVFTPAETVPSPAPEKPLESTADESLSFEATPLETTPSGPTLADLDEQTRGKAADEARAAVDAALGAMPFNPAGNPLQSAGAMPGLEVDHNVTVVSQPVESQDPSPPQIVLSSPALPPLPDFSTLPPLPMEEPLTAPAVLSDPIAPIVSPVETPSNPAEFKIPGQF